MKKIYSSSELILVILFFLYALIGCSGGSGGSNSSQNATPIAEIMLVQTEIAIGSFVTLDGTQSSDPDGDKITYNWAIVSLPENSSAQLDNFYTETTSFIPDYDGIYVFSLIVSDGKLSSAPATITINCSSQNISPTVTYFSVNNSNGLPLNSITFSWSVRDINNDRLSCTLDFTGGSGAIMIIPDCIATSTAEYSYENGGNYIPRLTVYDEKGGIGVADTKVDIASPIAINIVKPTINQFVGASLEIALTINSSLDISTVSARVVDREAVLLYSPNAVCYDNYGCGPGFGGTISMDGLARGEQVLEITAIDITGNSALSYRRFIYDKKPIVVVSEPLNDMIARPIIPLNVTCQDDSGPCNITVLHIDAVNTRTILATGIDNLVGEIDLSPFDGFQIRLTIEARDSYNQLTIEGRDIYVESSPNLFLVDTVDGDIFDLDDKRILYIKRGANGHTLFTYDRITGTTIEVPVPANLEISYGPSSGVAHLTPTGAIYSARDLNTQNPYHVYDWRNGALIQIDDGDPRTQASAIIVSSNDYAIWFEERNLLLRQFSLGTITIVSTFAGDADVARNGVVAYTSYPDLSIFSYALGITTKITNDISLSNMNVLTDGNGFVYVKSDSNNPQLWSIVYKNGTTETLLTSKYNYPPPKESFYQINNGWIAYSEFGSIGQHHIWTQNPQGAKLQRTIFGTDSYIDRLGQDGSVMLINSYKRYLSSPTGLLREINSDLGKPYQIGSAWYMAIGGSLFEVR